jgi:DNA-binding NarL/FixJ family response regulator
MPLKILIIDSQPLIRRGFCAVIREDPEMEIVGEASDGAEGLDLFKRTKPDLIIISLRLPDICAAEDLGMFFAVNAEVRIIVRTDSTGEDEIRSTFKQGAAGFLTAQATPAEILDAIRHVAGGSIYLPPELTETTDPEFPIEQLTPAERTVLRMMVGGMSNKEIAFALDISENTVKTHVRHIFEKLGVNDRTTATVTAIKRGLVRVDV